MVSGSKGGSTVQFIYDGLGRCVERITNGVGLIFAYDGWKPIAEWAADGSYWGFRIYGTGPDEVLWHYDSRIGYIRVHSDMHGNVMALLDWSGNGIEKYTYDAYGTLKITDWAGNVRSQSAVGNRFMFQGREWLPELGIYDYRHRYYQPVLGRFLQSDPMGLQTEGAKLTPEQKALYGAGAPEAFGSSEVNLFRYCGDDPVDKSDPLGLDDAAKLYKAIANFIKSLRPDVNGVNPQDVARVVVKDAQDAERQERNALRPGHGVNTGQERAYSEYAKDGSLVRSGPNIGKGYNQGPETPLPGPPKGFSQDANRLTGSHSHGPGSGPGLERADVPSANGKLGGLPYISSVGWTGDMAGTIQIYIPGREQKGSELSIDTAGNIEQAQLRGSTIAN